MNVVIDRSKQHSADGHTILIDAQMRKRNVLVQKRETNLKGDGRDRAAGFRNGARSLLNRP
jgi:hypothetical protein